MTTETDDRITTLLTDTRAALDDLGIREAGDESDADDEAGGDDGDEARALELTADLEGGAEDGLPEPISSTDLPSLAEEAHELVEEGDVQSLLERVGLDTLPDGSTPSSLPEAIANGDPGQVATLRALQRLASLADPDLESDSDSDLDDADSLEETVLDLYGLLTKSVAVETGDEEVSEADTDASDDAAEPDEEGEAGGDEDETDEDGMDEEGGEADQKDEDETDEDDESDEDDETDDGDLEDSISSALKDAVGGFGDEVESLKAGLEAAGLGDDEEADAEDEADPEDEEANGDDTDEEDGVEEEEADEAAEEVEDEDDDGLLSTGDDGGPFGGSSSGRRRGTMYSTVARSPSKRADMKSTTRHSTMPKRN